MNIHRSWRRVAASLTIFFLLACPGSTALALEAVDAGQEASLTVYFGEDGDGFAGVEFHLYQAGDMGADGSPHLTGDFAQYPVSLEELDNSGWRALAQTLDGYTARDGLEPLRTKKTGDDGQVNFAGLEPGLYLVTGDPYQAGSYTYTPEPFLVCLPNRESETDEWAYDAAVSCKYDSRYHPPEDEGGDTVNRKVLKVWKHDGNGEKRPEAIRVQLLRDGKVYDTVTLNESNNWRYTWTGLEEGSRWNVVELETPEGYTVSVEREGVTFVMTNTKRAQGEIPGDTWGNAPGGQPSKGGTSSAKPTLPQTGMLWWPVPLLACAGLLLFLIGWGRRNHEG